MLTSLVLIASLSPLLTFASLWQVKEWRIDRLKEHLRAEGWFRQICGLVRPIIVATALVTGFIELGIYILAIATAAQIILKKQKYPVWTKKAVILVSGSLLIVALVGPLLLVLTPLLQPLVLFVAWTIFLPLDTVMKKRIISKATLLRSQYSNITCIGITGSVGKTTVKELIAHLLSDKNILATPKYINSELGIAKWLLTELPKKNRDENIILIVEMGAYSVGEIQTLCTMTQPRIGVLTYIGTQHIALFGSQEKLTNAKAELIECLPKEGFAFINADNALSLSVMDRTRATVHTVGITEHADKQATDIIQNENGLSWNIDSQKFETAMQGTHNIPNLLLAISVAENLRIPRQDIAQKLASYLPPHHTFSVSRRHGVLVLDDTHNASKESFLAALHWVKDIQGKKKILITPGLIELGAEQDQIHSDLGIAAAKVIDRVIFTAPLSKKAFQSGYKHPVEMYRKDMQKLSQNDVLLCIGRVHPKAIERLLP